LRRCWLLGTVYIFKTEHTANLIRAD
jgi:hypothetical protein